MHAIQFVVMDNMLGERVDELYRMYDLKGSTFKRYEMEVNNPKKTLKDLNFLENI